MMSTCIPTLKFCLGSMISFLRDQRRRSHSIWHMLTTAAFVISTSAAFVISTSAAFRLAGCRCRHWHCFWRVPVRFRRTLLRTIPGAPNDNEATPCLPQLPTDDRRRLLATCTLMNICELHATRPWWVVPIAIPLVAYTGSLLLISWRYFTRHGCMRRALH